MHACWRQSSLLLRVAVVAQGGFCCMEQCSSLAWSCWWWRTHWWGLHNSGWCSKVKGVQGRRQLCIIGFLDSSSLFSSPRSHVKLSKRKAFPRKEVLPVCLCAELPVTRCDSLDSWLLSWNMLPFKYFTSLLMWSSWGKQPRFQQPLALMCRDG